MPNWSTQWKHSVTIQNWVDISFLYSEFPIKVFFSNISKQHQFILSDSARKYKQSLKKFVKLCLASLCKKYIYNASYSCAINFGGFIAEHIGLLLTNGQICQQSLAAKKKTLTFFSRSDSKS